MERCYLGYLEGSVCVENTLGSRWLHDSNIPAVRSVILSQAMQTNVEMLAASGIGVKTSANVCCDESPEKEMAEFPGSEIEGAKGASN